ncbi:MAG: molybdopterin-dependent oxidoreductase [Dehalococcoidia bacterium]|nr:molybdopterin-dependent oxidoreductase [Dehalococcoidia bacterium]
MTKKNDTKVVKSLCHMCLSCCGIDAHVEDGRLVKVTGMKEHPVNRLCVKAQTIPDLLYSPERITHPMRKVDGTWHRISWDEAFDIIGDKLASIKENYGAKALVVHLGQPMINTEVPRLAARFCSLYGTPNYTTGASLCFAARAIGHGLSMSRRMLPLHPSYRNPRCVVVWGHNPQQSKIGEEADILSAQKQGAKLIVVDPRATPLAKGADIHIQIRPGTDCALALGLLNVIIAEELYDRDFVKNWSFGFDKLKEHVKKYSPEVVEKIASVPAKAIRQFARMYATSRPATISQGVSLDHCTNGVQNSRAISILIAITGNLDILGGNIYNSPLRQTSLRIKGMVSVDEAIGADYPIFGKFTGETTAMPVADAIITENPYPVRALIVQGCNPALTWPDSNKVRQAFQRLDLLVVSDLFMTETAKLADIFLPATAFSERKIIKDYSSEGLPLISLSNKVVEPLANCLEDWQIWSELGRKMGYAEYFPWQSTDELFAYLLEPSGITLEKLERNPGGILYRQLGRQRKYEEEGLATPSGKVEIFSQTMADFGYDPLPTFTEPLENPVGDPELSESYPFTLITGTRVNAFTHSQHRNIARLRKLVPQPLVEINPAPAKKLGIADGDQVVVESPKGNIKLQAKITADIHPKVLSLQHGWDEANANILTDGEQHDPISGYPGFKTTLCQVRKASG